MSGPHINPVKHRRVSVFVSSPDSTFKPSPVTYSTPSARPKPSAPWSRREDCLPREPFYAYVCLRWNRNLDGCDSKRKERAREREKESWVTDIFQSMKRCLSTAEEMWANNNCLLLWIQVQRGVGAGRLAFLQTQSPKTNKKALLTL